MTCFENEDWIDLYLDGRLSPAEQARFEEHLAGCPTCQGKVAQLSTVFAALDLLQPVPVPADFRAQVMAGLPRHMASPVARWLLLAQAAASLLLLALALPTLRAWYAQVSAWLAPGWLSRIAADVTAWARGVWASVVPALTLDLNLSWPQGLGLAWPQAAILAVALVGLWVLGNRLLLTAASNARGGTT
jgi:anti-sigma factor RsiW